MKQTLRHIFLLVALFAATANLSAQTYNGGTWYSLYDANEYSISVFESKTFNVFTPTLGNLTFEAKRQTAGQGNLQLIPIVNGADQSAIFSNKLNTSYTSYSLTLSNQNTTQLKFYAPTGVTLKKYFKNVKLPLAKHILLESGTYGTSSITVTDGNLATAEGYTSTNAYKIKLRSFLASDNIKMTSSNSEFHFGGGVTEVYLGVANNYCASANGSGNCSATTLGQISNYFKDVYFSPSVQYNANARSTTITITDGVNTAYVYLTAPVIPTYYFKAEAIAEPTTAGVATATFVNGQSTYSLVAPNVGTNSMSTDVTFAASAGANSVFEGWKKPSEDSYYKQGVETASFKETITSSVLDPRGMASQKTYRAIFSERYTASMETNDISGLKVGGRATAVYSFINTSAAIPSSDENADFHYVITHRPDNTTKNGSADASKVVSFDPTTKQVVGLNSGSATITFVQKANANYVYVEKSFEVTVEKNDISAWIVKGDAVLNELVENAFSVTDGLQDYGVESLNSGIAEYVVGNKIQTYFTEGTAQFRVTRDEDYKYNELDKTLTLEVYPAGGCNLLTAPDEVTQEYSLVWEDRIYQLVDLNGIADSLIFKLSRNNNDAVGKTEVQQYVNGGWSTIASVMPEGKNVFNDYKFPLDSTATKVRFYNGYGSYKRTFKDVYVTRKTYLRPSVSSLALPQATIGKPVSASFDLSWSTCSDEIVLVSTNSNFVLSKSSIDATSGRGTTTITVTYDANSGSQFGTIFIYDQSQKIEIPVSCEVKPKLTTEIIYTGEATYPETPDGIPYPFYVKDENGNTVQGAKITLKTSNEDILSVDSTKIYPHCGGNVTLTANYAGDDTHEPSSLSKTIFVIECYQHIVWDQNFKTYLATEEGYIDETTLLTAYAVTADGIPTENPIQYTLDEKADSIADIQYNGDGTYSLYVHGVGKGHIIARATVCTFEGEQYVAAESMHELRVKRVGEKCESVESVVSDEFSLSGLLFWEDKEKICELEGRPYSSLEFYSHVNNDSYDNHISVSFSTDNQATWTDATRYENISNVYNWYVPFVCNSIPDGATHVKFRAESTRNTYINMVSAAQRSYFEVDQTAIEITDAKVNVPFTRQLVLSFSDVPLVRYHVTNSHDLGLTLTPDRPVDNDCGDWGTYTFTLRGESPYPQQAVQETITLSTSSGEQVEIPVTITATLSDPFYFNQQAGDWSVSTHWTYQGNTNHGLLPDKAHPVVISKALTIGNDVTKSELVAYSVQIENGGSVEIKENGGLTVHAGGFEGVNENNLTIHSDTLGAGFVRVSPFFTTKVPGTMPNAKVNFMTKANMNAGDRDAAWQYIGAPGSGVGMDLAHTTVLYLRSEEKGWVRQYTEWAQLTPFAGYALTQKEQKTFTLYPQLLNENVTIPLTYTSNGMKGDNLWANSYMAPLDITKFSPGDFTGNVDYTFYLYNSGSWNDWNKDQSATNDANVSTPGRYYAINLAQIDATKDQTVIPPMQGVYMTAGEGGGTLTINYEKHVWNNSQTGKMNTPLRIAPHSEENQSADFLRIRLQVNSENSGADRMYVIQDSLATSGYDNGYDAPKQMATGLMNIYTNEPFGKMEISSTDHMDGMYIGFEAGEDSEYAMTFTSLLGDSLYLYDSQQDLIIEMVNDEQYHFIAEPYSVNDFRFQIMVAPELSEEDNNNQGGVTTNVDNISTPSVWVNQGKLYVTNSQENSTIAIYTASGMLMAAPYTIKHTPCTINIAHLPAGVYVLRLNDQAYKFICE